MIFDWFKKPDYTNVVKFPETKTPYIVPPTREPETKVFYRIGVTDDNRVAFQVGYSELTMPKLAVEHLIQQLQVFRDQLKNSEDNDDPT
jgi:hypothetical protein